MNPPKQNADSNHQSSAGHQMHKSVNNPNQVLSPASQNTNQITAQNSNSLINKHSIPPLQPKPLPQITYNQSTNPFIKHRQN